MKSLKKEVKRLLSLLVAVAVIVVSVPQEYLTVQAAEMTETGEDKETAESARQERDVSEEGETVPEKSAPETSEKAETEENGGTESQIATESSVTEKETGNEIETESKTETQTAAESQTTEETEPQDSTEIPGEETTKGTADEELTIGETQTDLTEENTEEETATEEMELREENRKVSRTGHGDDGKNENVTWTIYTNGDLEVTGEGEIISSDNWVPWSSYTSEIITAKINVTGATRAQRLFYECYNLKTVDLSGFPTANVTDMSSMFCNCRSLTSINLSNFKTASVTNMSSMFYNCELLTGLDVSNFDTANVTDMSSMFYSCKLLTGLDVSNFDTANVTNMNGMFQNCQLLADLDVSKFNTSGVTDTSYMFSGCKALVNLDVSKFDTNKVTQMYDMFYDCASLTRLDLSSFVIGKNTSVSSMLYGCDSLTEIVNPYGIDSDMNIYLPTSSSDTSSWRWPDGEKTDVLCRLLKEEDGPVILSRGKMLGISFQGRSGAQFTLTDERYKDKVFHFSTTDPEEVEIVERGAEGAKTFTFTIVPDDGYIIKSVALKAGEESKAQLTAGELENQYIMTPIDENEGYTQDEVIYVTVVPFSEYQLSIDCSDSRNIEDIIVVNGDNKTEGKPSSAQVSNRYDTTIYVKVKNESGSNAYLPRMRYYDYEYKEIPCEQSTDSMSDAEKEYFQNGYAIFRLGRIDESITVQVYTVTAYRMKFTTVDFPGEVHIYGYTEGVNYQEVDSSGQLQQPIEYPVGEELFLESGRRYIQVKWTDTPEGTNKWCRPQVTLKYSDNENIVNPTTLTGVDGDVWEIDPDNMEVSIALKPHTIELTDFDFANIVDYSIDNPYAKFYEKEVKMEYYPYTSVWKQYIDVYGGDSLVLSLTLDDGLKPNWSTDSRLTYTNDGSLYTIAVKNMSEIWELTTINLNTYDPQDRVALSSLSLTPVSTLRFKGVSSGNPVYTGEPIEPMSLHGLYAEDFNYGKPKRIKLAEGRDYTWACQNNVNAGEAYIVITAVPTSARYRGATVIPFTIEKAEAPEAQERTEQVELIAGQTAYQVNLSDVFAMDHLNEKGIKPSEYKLVSCEKGEVLASDSEPVLEGDKLTYTPRSDANKNSAQAKIVFDASFTNYHDCRLTLNIQVVKKETLVLGGTVTVADKIYDGKELLPDMSGLKVVSKEGTSLGEQEAAKILAEIQDTLSYHYIGTEGTVYDSDISPVDIGTYQIQARVADANLDYKSEYLNGVTFRITQRAVTITADDVMLYLYDTIPAQYQCSADGLAEGDFISSRQFITCDSIKNTDTVGEYSIVVNTSAAMIADAAGRDVTKNYNITGQNGKLEVCTPPSGSYTITYTGLDPLDPRNTQKDMKRSGNEAGKLIERPTDPTANGYIFLGWFIDEASSKEWDFAADIILSDLTLYAGWSKQTSQSGGVELCVQDIMPQTYTGSAIKPAVTVYAADGKTRLKLKKDYTITYKNNTNADTKNFPNGVPEGGVGETLSDTAQGFNSSLPYVIITGKGNYTGTVYANFHINPADVSQADRPASDFILKYTDQFDEKPGKYAAVVTQLKYKKKSLKYGVDYTLTVKKAGSEGADAAPVTLNAKGQLPLTAGSYRLVIEGKGNYTGMAGEKALYVADKTKLLKNAKVTGISAVSNVTKEQLANGVEPDLANLVVKLNNNVLAKGKDYNVAVDPSSNRAVGTANVIITPAEGSGLVGFKSVAFQIKGAAFKANALQFTGWQDAMPYTGKALTQNDVVLKTIDGKDLTYGEDYTVSYKSNIKKGTATMVFTANPSSGYSGSFSKKFKITPMDLSTAIDNGTILINGAEKNGSGWKLSESVPYQKSGAAPADKVSLQFAGGAALTAGKGGDYTVSYANNKSVSNGTAYMTVKGTGNYTGNVNIYFDITTASLARLMEEGRVTITSASIKVGYPYSRYYEDYGDGEGEWVDGELKDPDHEFKPAVTVKDGKTPLKQGVDYTVSYSGNTRSELESSDVLQATITGIGDYGLDSEAIELNITVNRRALSAGKVTVEYENEFTYTGEQIMPGISEVSYKISNGHGREDSDDYEPPEWDSLTEGQDYRVEYTKNIAKGTGTIKIIGIGSYTGSVSKKFKIVSKAIYSRPGQSGGSEEGSGEEN